MTALRPGTKLGPREIVARQTRVTTVMADRVSKTKRSSSSPVVPAIVSVSRTNLTLTLLRATLTLRWVADYPLAERMACAGTLYATGHFR
jgi:hypothetical protein